jgi:hypothetical protein
MTDTQHTPGPWRVNDTAYRHSFHIVDGDGAFVADTDRCNARLIAAAPKMFAALVDAESAMFHVLADGGIDTPADREAMENALRDARAALEEATRRQS